ncbi:MAG: hypothetical protein QXI33_02465 [Candidatus Pacearchaeota archaeon]
MLNKIINLELENEFLFVIPTYRLRAVKDTIRRYTDNFHSYGHEIPVFIFDDSSNIDNNFYSLSEGLSFKGDIFYVGLNEKRKFLDSLHEKTSLDKLLLHEIFKPSYGGNRNFTLVYSLGNKFVSSDDDMYPYGLFESSRGLNEGEVCKGRYVDKVTGRYFSQNQDIITSFLDVLGKKVSDLQYKKGGGIEDSMMDLFTNTTKKKIGKSVLTLLNGSPDENSLIKIAQTFRTGSSDVDMKDYAKEFLVNPELLSKNDMSQIYVISDYIPCITDSNWRIDCGVSGYDNSRGLPPFIPTKLRFEDYVFRIWAQKKDVASAHVNSVQTHRRNPFNRPSLPQDYHNEELANLLKDELRKLTNNIGDITISFEGKIDFDNDILFDKLKKAQKLHKKALLAVERVPERKGYFIPFANGLYNTFSRFENNEFFHTSRKIMENEFNLLRRTMEVWPKIVEASFDIPKPVRKIYSGGLIKYG